MRAIHWAIIAFALILTCLWAMFTLSAKAGECYTIAAFKADVAAHGDTVVGEAQYHGVNSDVFVIVESTRGIIGMAFKGGCLVTPVPLDDYAAAPVKPVEPGASKNGTGA